MNQARQLSAMSPGVTAIAGIEVWAGPRPLAPMWRPPCVLVCGTSPNTSQTGLGIHLPHPPGPHQTLLPSKTTFGGTGGYDFNIEIWGRHNSIHSNQNRKLRAGGRFALSFFYHLQMSKNKAQMEPE